jgi:hypothetical protein
MGEDFGATHAVLLAIAAVALGLALQVNDGAYSPIGLVLLAIALVATFAPFFAKVERRLPVTAILAGLVALELAVVAFRPIAAVFPVKGAMLWPFATGMFASAILVFAIAFAPARALRFLVPLLLVAFVATAIWVIRQARPVIDVFIFQQSSSKALLEGRNPWALTFRNPYAHTRFYGPGLVVDGRLQFGYPYPPLPLLMVLPAYLLAHDIRYAHVLAVAGAAGLIAYSRPGREAALAAALFLFTPRVFLLLLLGWIEPLVVLLFALLVFTLLRRPKLVPWAFGLFLAVKQYLVFVPFLAGLVARGRALVRLFSIAALVAFVAIVPLAVWNFRAFFHSAVSLQMVQPFRRDALSFAALLANLTGAELSSLAFLAVVPAIFVAARKAPKSAAGFATAVAATYLTFFAFNKQAFANYYYFVIGALCVAVAAVTPAATKSAAVEAS